MSSGLAGDVAVPGQQRRRTHACPGIHLDHCFQQLEGTDQRLLDCDAPIPEAESAAILQTLRGSDALLQNLRYWATWLRVSTFVLDDADKKARTLEARLAAKR